MGQPDDAAARPRERPLPDRDRAGVREHDLRRSAARELPAEDELPDRHAVRPVAEVGQAGEGRRAVGRRSDRGSAGTRIARATTRISAPARSAPTTGTGAPGSSALIRRTSSSCSRRAPPTARRTRRSGRRTTRCTRSSPGLLDSYEVAGNKKALEIAKGMGAWTYARLKALPPRDADQHVEPLHRRRVRRHERSHGAPVPADRRQAVPRVREAVRQHELLLRQRQPRARPGQERGHDPRQARQPAHPADHRRARNVPQHAGDAVLPDRRRTSGRS